MDTKEKVKEYLEQSLLIQKLFLMLNYMVKDNGTQLMVCFFFLKLVKIQIETTVKYIMSVSLFSRADNAIVTQGVDNSFVEYMLEQIYTRCYGYF